MDPFQSHYAYPSSYKLNPDLMRKAASYFIGRHDFTSFANASRNDGSVNPVKEIFCFHAKEMDPVLQIEVDGTDFLYRQVRNMGSRSWIASDFSIQKSLLVMKQKREERNFHHKEDSNCMPSSGNPHKASDRRKELGGKIRSAKENASTTIATV